MKKLGFKIQRQGTKQLNETHKKQTSFDDAIPNPISIQAPASENHEKWTRKLGNSHDDSAMRPSLKREIRLRQSAGQSRTVYKWRSKNSR